MTNDNKLTKCRGRARELISVWEEERKEKNQLWINTCLPPECGRAETLTILTNMFTRNDWRPGNGPSQALGGGSGNFKSYGLEVGLQAPNHREQSHP